MAAQRAVLSLVAPVHTDKSRGDSRPPHNLVAFRALSVKICRGILRTSDVSVASTRHSRLSLKLPPLRHAPSSRLASPFVTCHVSTDQETAETSSNDEDASSLLESNLTEKLASLGIFALWAALLAYAFLLSPNQTPSIDQYYLEKLIGLRDDDGFVVNSVVLSLWNIMGVFPLVYSMLLIPASRTTRTRVPTWPFVALSVAFGVFALLPYFALWTAGDPSVPSEEERGKVALRLWESKITAGVVLFGALGLTVNAATAPAIDWQEFWQIIRQSRLFHVTTCDFLLLTLSAPFWMYNDMSYRNWEPRNSWGLGLLCTPLLGPFLYVLLRPGLPPVPSQSRESSET